MTFTLLQVFIFYVLTVGILSFYYKERFFLLFKNLPFPAVHFWFIAIFISVIEEFFTAGTDFPNRLLTTVPIFLLMFLCIFLIYKKLKLSHTSLIVIFGLIGTVNEFLVVGRIFIYPVSASLVMIPLTFLIYAVTAYLPTWYLTRGDKEKTAP
jgi:hypothetical protein